MERYKNEASIVEVQSVLGSFQELYNRKDSSQLENYIKNAFSYEDKLLVLGNDMNQWCQSEDEIKELIKSHWKTENNYWKQIDFKFEDARVYANENTAWVISIGNITNTISEEEQLEATINLIKETMKKDRISKVDAINAAKEISYILKDVEHGENYIWPFRFTCVLVKEYTSWKFHQMQFSLDAESWGYRCADENYDKNLFEMPKAGIDTATEEVKKALEIFQKGYINRDLNYVDDYMKEVFLPSDDLVVIGTDAGELCIGVDAVRGIIESDWKYWGDFRFNLEDTVISVRGDVAYFTTKAILKRTVTTEKTLEWIKSTANYHLKAEKKPKDKLMDTLRDTLDLLCENEKGELYITPMRFSGVLVKQEGKWLISHLQYSDYRSNLPGVRIFK